MWMRTWLGLAEVQTSLGTAGDSDGLETKLAAFVGRVDEGKGNQG